MSLQLNNNFLQPSTGIDPLIDPSIDSAIVDYNDNGNDIGNDNGNENIKGFTTAQGALTLVGKSIKNNDLDMLRKLMLIIPIERMDANAVDSFFTRHMDLCTLFSRIECLLFLYDQWYRAYPGDEKMSLFTMLVMMPSMNAATLSFLNSGLRTFSFLEVMNELIGHDANPYLPLACQKLIDIFGEQPMETYGLLLEISVDNLEVYQFIADKFHAVAPYAQIPVWMGNFIDTTSPENICQSDTDVVLGSKSRNGSREELRTGTGYNDKNECNPLPLESEVPLITKEMGQFKIPTLDEVVRLLTEGLVQNGLDPDKILEAQDALKRELIVATPQQKIELVKPVMELKFQESLQSDVELFRICGPSNPLLDSYGDDLVYDGVRMFTSTIFDYDEEEQVTKDWYEGFCHQCNFQIRRRWHAVRIPGEKGGWFGCFCSWKCARYAVDDVGFNPEMEPKMLTHQLINVFEKQMLQIGIQDRITDNPEVARETSLLIRSLTPTFDHQIEPEY